MSEQQTIKTVWVGMSGGVDSSVAALLLLQQGYTVVGTTLKLRETGMQQDIADAHAVCEALGIEHRVLDFTDRFSRCVIDPFTHEYCAGRTPNPCVVCNRTIKFGALLDTALDNGADAIATGHYAKTAYDPQRGRYLLYRTDSPKDQSYVLYGLSQFQLAHTLFPITGMSKEQVRSLAAEYHLPVASKSDSMEICFVPDGKHAEYIEECTGSPLLPGDFVDEDGNILGRHQGIARYTIGQRKGLGIAAGKPVYVVRIDASTNTVVLGEEGRQYASELTAGQFNYIAIDPPSKPLRLKAKIRYQAPAVDALLIPQEDETVRVVFDAPQRSITPGQAVVFFDGNLVIGGGTIL